MVEALVEAWEVGGVEEEAEAAAPAAEAEAAEAEAEAEEARKAHCRT